MRFLCHIYDQGILLQVVVKAWPSFAISTKVLNGGSSINYFAVKQCTCPSCSFLEHDTSCRGLEHSFLSLEHPT